MMTEQLFTVSGFDRFHRLAPVLLIGRQEGSNSYEVGYFYLRLLDQYHMHLNWSLL
jgi:hypothetical protein